MEKLTDPNPYEILNITPDADRATIKQAMAEKQRQNKDQIARQQARNARQTLSLTSKRLVVDALIPDFLGSNPVHNITTNFDQQVEPLDWQEIANPKQILHDDFEAFILATLRYILGDIPEPEQQITLADDFDGLDEFLTEWLE